MEPCRDGGADGGGDHDDPSLIRRLGTDRFGVLTLAWALIGYFSLFDLAWEDADPGRGRENWDRAEQDVPVVLRTALTLMIVLGLLACSRGRC